MAYSITLKPSGRSFPCKAGNTILQAGLDQGLKLPYGCRDGACGACIATLIEGEISYEGREPLGLSEAEREQGKILPCLAVPQSDLVIELEEMPLQAHPARVLPVRVEGMQQLAHDVMQLWLKPPAMEPLDYAPGQYINILLKDGRKRAFSLASAPREDGLLELHIRHVSGGSFTDFVFEHLHEDQRMRIEGPLGRFTLHENRNRPMLLVAGGTGFAPIKAIIEQLIASGFERPLKLFWGVRARRDLYMGALAETWAAEHDNIDFVPVLSQPLPEDGWQGETGYVHEAVIRQVRDVADYDIYLCGPPVMVETAGKALVEAGACASDMFSDAFEYSADTLRAIAAARRRARATD